MKKIKIAYYKIRLWITSVNINMAHSDLKIFEKREIKFESKLRVLGVELDV